MKEELEKQTALLNEIKFKFDEILNVIKSPPLLAGKSCHSASGCMLGFGAMPVSCQNCGLYY